MIRVSVSRVYGRRENLYQLGSQVDTLFGVKGGTGSRIVTFVNQWGRINGVRVIDSNQWGQSN